ncbi:hypothetical protein I7I53_07483 [Histoplasma capsulatum var. duboisii H88]|uniref:DUF7924 domain-containing protein n=1 Tax=Ajellomyces capsulatus (strain H88) TaxID=544711 RepID=A0A8A1LDJ3_AJEC8|nr:hypothetical protein I7I53_07483 [Histoplasma capsulatum var. duboisii H88]
MNMASRQAKYHKKRGRQPPALQGNSELFIQKEALPSSCRRSARLSQRYHSCEQETKPPTSRSLEKTVNNYKRKRTTESGEPLLHPARHLEKRQCTDHTSAGEDAVNGIKEHRNINLPPIQAVNPETLHGPVLSQSSPNKHKRLHSESERLSDNPDPPSKRPRTNRDRLIEHWTLNEYRWPENPLERDTMEHFLARPKSPSLRRTKSNGSLNAPSETSSREAKSRPYTDKNYEVYLEIKGSFMERHKNGVSGDSMDFYQELLVKDVEVPKDTVFEDNAFESTCERLSKYNETGVIRIIGELIVPSAGSAMDLGRVTFPHLVVSVNESWDSSREIDEAQQLSPPAQVPPQSRPFRLSRPQPDYGVGFPRQAFTKNQLGKLAPFVGNIGDASFFMGTAYMYFPFMTAEVKCGKAALDIADRQNAHSMTLSVRGVVKLFRLVKREKELHQQILAFSISHDHCSVRIYGHYPVIEGENTTYYRHPIHRFDFTSLDGKEKWTSYKFVMSVYNNWAPFHFKRLCSAIDEAEILQQSELSFSESSGLSQRVQGVDIQGSSVTSVLEEETHSGSKNIPSNAAEKQSAEAFKMPRKRRK